MVAPRSHRGEDAAWQARLIIAYRRVLLYHIHWLFSVHPLLLASLASVQLHGDRPATSAVWGGAERGHSETHSRSRGVHHHATIMPFCSINESVFECTSSVFLDTCCCCSIAMPRSQIKRVSGCSVKVGVCFNI